MKMVTPGRRTLAARLVVIACALLCAPAMAQESRSYAVLSLAADNITLVFARVVTGSHLDQHVREVHALPDDSLDIVAVQAAEAALKRIDANSSVELYSTRDPKLYALQNKQADGDPTAPAVINSLKALLAQSKATHLILISKHRADATFAVADGTVGVGRVSGIGFYVDGTKRLRNIDTGHQAIGFVSPYAYLKIELIAVADRKTLHEAVSMQSALAPAYPSSSASAWDAMTNAQKVQGLQDVIRSAVADAVPRVLHRP